MVSVFLSYPKPHLQTQEDFISKLTEELNFKGYKSRTLGVTDYNKDAPLVAIRQLMNECCGIITIAFKRTLIHSATIKSGGTIMGCKEKNISNVWLTSQYCQIEPAMAFQSDLPSLIWREKGVVEDGILEKGVLGVYMPEFCLDSWKDIFKSDEWDQLFQQWSKEVKRFAERKGHI